LIRVEGLPGLATASQDLDTNAFPSSTHAGIDHIAVLILRQRIYVSFHLTTQKNGRYVEEVHLTPLSEVIIFPKPT